MPEGTKGLQRNWTAIKLENGDDFGGWYRYKGFAFNSDYDFFYTHLDAGGTKSPATVAYKLFNYSTVTFCNLGVEYDTHTISGITYLDFYIPYDFEFAYTYSGKQYIVKTEDYSKVVIDSKNTCADNLYKLIVPEEFDVQNKPTLQNLSLGINGNEDNVDRSKYVEKSRNAYALCNSWFRFKVPGNDTATTYDIANVETTLNGQDYNAKLYYVVDYNNEKSLRLGRFDVDYKEVTYNGVDYIEFCIPNGKTTYYATSDAIVTNTLNIGIMDSIRRIDNSLVKLEFDLNAALKSTVNPLAPYAPILAVLGGMLLISGTCIIISLYYSRHKK